MMQNQRFEDPKIQLILSIKQHDEKITYFLENNRYKDAAKSIHYLLERLEINELKDDKAIRDLREKISVKNYHHLSIDDLDYAYKIIHEFLNRTYYKGFSNNRPPTRKSSLKDIGEALE